MLYEVITHDTIKDVDLRTVMTIFNIEKEAPNVHTIAEINDERNAEIIKDKIEGDEILYKELIDSKIISSCINHKHLSNMFYELFGTEKNKRLFETDLETVITSYSIHYTKLYEKMLIVSLQNCWIFVL